MFTTVLFASIVSAQFMPMLAARPAYFGDAVVTQATGTATAIDAAPFLGDWTLALQGPNGPGNFDLSVKVEKDKVVGEIGSEQLPKQAITDISKVDKKLLLRYSFMYEGNPVDTLVTLTPADDGKVAAQIDFAAGAYVMTGTAAKKDKAK